MVALVPSGGYAEYAVAHSSAVYDIPEGLDEGAALALLIQGLTAWHLFRTSAELARRRVAWWWSRARAGWGRSRCSWRSPSVRVG